MESWRQQFDAEMRRGRDEYADIIAQLLNHGLPTTFTQTGGMNAALEVQLETGDYLLVTDAHDSLPLHRADQQGWGVGLYRAESADTGPDIFASSPTATSDALLQLVRELLLPPPRQ